MIGDFYRNFGYPYIDTANGGSLKGLIDALDLTMKLAGPDTKLIPGHGTLINRTDIAPYRDMIFAVQEKVRAMIAQGATRAAGARRESDGALRREGRGRTSARRRRRHQRRPLRQRGLPGTETRRLGRTPSSPDELSEEVPLEAAPRTVQGGNSS